MAELDYSIQARFTAADRLPAQQVAAWPDRVKTGEYPDRMVTWYSNCFVFSVEGVTYSGGVVIDVSLMEMVEQAPAYVLTMKATDVFTRFKIPVEIESLTWLARRNLTICPVALPDCWPVPDVLPDGCQVMVPAQVVIKGVTDAAT